MSKADRLGFSFIFIVLAVSSFMIENLMPPVIGQAEKKSVYTLNEKERETWNQFGGASEQLQKNLQELINRTPTVPLNCQSSMELHGALKDTLSQMQIVTSKRDTFLAQLQASKSCPDCKIENGALVGGPPKP